MKEGLEGLNTAVVSEYAPTGRKFCYEPPLGLSKLFLVAF